MPTAGSMLKPIRDLTEGEAAVSRQLASQVNNKRTPTGQFFTTINPTLYEKQPPPATYEGQNITDTAVATMRGSGRFTGTGGTDARVPADLGQTQGSIGADIGSGGTTTLPPIGGSDGKRANWLLPWQTGDRQLGKVMADAIRHKRTPIGAFANRDLAKPNK
ncbi:hypothetical protein VOLCADRAFT_103383 [Volvox carteri f. nagariensis]|uniref:Uncharacterized protein n=1 Tax=Volvox carteri f. nagariensis TaxID=3068 RepID=D8TLJ2_VOLCA|nr:uncharacterized protein VOLCADRAFT_103383 [Volvox carteri f. nagariensis]EFJ51884.1 hypothetical protein VOLCADRAFT_103383 [Volvox carteri f. nagariensis]|eukprot:XP_002947294.1 hypothetical protein VOLCADRAFT_103383 [Volvox carteri f. nagariensis]